MIIYCIVFFISIIFTFFAEKFFKENKKKRAIIFSILAIFVPSILAGIRDLSVGFDCKRYVSELFEKALVENSFINFVKSTDVEILYCVFSFVLTKLTKNIHWILFFTQLIILTCVYLFAYSKRNKVSMTLVMAVYLLMFYNTTLNIARQSIAIGFILISLIFFEKKAYKRTILFFIIAELFHKTSIFAIPLYFIIIFENTKFSRKTKTIVYSILFAILVFCVLEYANILKVMVYNLKICPEKYYSYLSDSRLVYEKPDINKMDLFIYVFTVLLYLGLYKKHGNKERIYFISFLINVALFPITFKMKNGARIGMYYSWPGTMIIYPTIIQTALSLKKENNKKSSVIVGISVLALIFVLIFYWYWIYIHYNISVTYPYVSDIVKFVNF